MLACTSCFSFFKFVIKINKKYIENMTEGAYNKNKQGDVSMKGEKNGGKYN